jgi:hypothetical protein
LLSHTSSRFKGEKCLRAADIFIFLFGSGIRLILAFHYGFCQKKFSIPAEVTSIDAAAEYCRRQFQGARAKIQQGKADECAKILLGVAVMVVTPMTAK